MPDFTREELAHIGTVGINQGTKYADVAVFALRLMDERDARNKVDLTAKSMLEGRLHDEQSARAKDVEALRESLTYMENAESAWCPHAPYDDFMDPANPLAQARARIAAWEKDNA